MRPGDLGFAVLVTVSAQKDPHTESIMVAPGPLLAGVPRKHVKIQVANGLPTKCIMLAPGSLLAGVPRKHVNIRVFWAAVFLFATNRMHIGADLRHCVLRGSLKCVVEARSPQIVGLRSVVNSHVNSDVLV